MTPPDAVVGAPRRAFIPSPVFLGLVAFSIGCGWATWHQVGNVRLAVFGFVVASWLVSLCLHEYAHAVVAFRAGDLGVAERGYLRLNPLKYSHPLLSIVLPVVVVVLGGIGLPGGAVWIEHHRIPGRLRHTLVSAAGPATNVLFTLAVAVPFLVGFDTSQRPAFWAALALIGFLQLTASALNLLPMPGLDGGNMLHPWLSPRWRRGYDALAPYGFILLFALLMHPLVGGPFFAGMYFVADLIGLPSDLYGTGLRLLRFWS